MSQYLYGVHDFDPAWAARVQRAGRTAWCVTTHAMTGERSYDFRALAEYAVTPIARLNAGYAPVGTIPQPSDYADFAKACRAFVEASPGCTRFIIGNETNMAIERPQGVPISPTDYARCFRLCRQAIKDVLPEAQVYPAAVAPWNIESGPWLAYFEAMLAAIGAGNLDGITLHTYSRGADPALITSNAKMDPPYQAYHSGFRAYRDFLSAIPTTMRHLPVHITETNQNAPWVNANTGWVQAAYAEIDAWNRQAGTQKIQSLVLYRWPKYDQWYIEGKEGVLQDLEAAMRHDYVSPATVSSPGDPEASGEHSSYFPVVLGEGSDPPPSSPPAQVPPRQWDERLTQRGVRVEDAPPGAAWRVIKGEWLDEKQSGGRHHIYVDTLDEQGNRVAGVSLIVQWPDGTHRITSEEKRGEPYSANFPMSASLNEFSIVIADGMPSDRVVGIGMGAYGNPRIHTSTVLVFQRVRATQAPQTPNHTAIDPDAPQRPSTPATGPSKQEQPMTDIIDPLVGQTIVQVESGGQPFGPDGRLLIRFENHIFKGKLGDDALYARHFQHGSPVWTGHRFRRSDSGPWQEVHTGSQASEYAAFEFAASLNRQAAFESISMGLGQIMGFNARRVGYASAEAMYRSFSQSSAAQVMAFINFFLSDPQLVQAMRVRDWRTIARLYNGPGNVDNVTPLLEATYRRLAAAA